MTKEQILKNADACAEEVDKLRKENECNNAKIDTLIERERILRKQAASVLSPEQIFLDIIDGCTIKIDKLKYPNSIFLFKGDDWMFEIENSNIWCRWDKVWARISESIHGDYQATQAFLKMQVEDHFKIKGVTPWRKRRPEIHGWKTTSKLRVLHLSGRFIVIYSRWKTTSKLRVLLHNPRGHGGDHGGSIQFFNIKPHTTCNRFHNSFRKLQRRRRLFPWPFPSSPISACVSLILGWFSISKTSINNPYGKVRIQGNTRPMEYKNGAS